MNLYPLGKAITYPLVRLLFRMRYRGLEHLPEKGGYIIACNHRSNFDPVVIAHKLSHQVHYMAKAELTTNRLVGWLIKSLGVIPVERGKGDTSSIERSVELIHSGGVLGMFPEGHRSKDGKPLRPRSGVALIAGQTGADILPCAVEFGEKLRFRSRITVHYGPLINNEELGIDLAAPSTIRAASKRIMDEIVSMLPPNGQGEDR